MYEQTDDFRWGLTEGVITCYLADFLDVDEFWYVIDNYIYADHEDVFQRIHDCSDWLEIEKRYELITGSPSTHCFNFLDQYIEYDELYSKDLQRKLQEAEEA